jgi:predicted deacetylase
MTAGALVADLAARGMVLRRRGLELRAAPRRLLTDADRAALRAAKTDVLAVLADLEELERDGTAAQLRTIAATLTAEEYQRLAAEMAAGDRLAELIIGVLAPPRAEVAALRCRCGGIAWEPDPSGTGERCAACGTWSPCSVADDA